MPEVTQLAQALQAVGGDLVGADRADDRGDLLALGRGPVGVGPDVPQQRAFVPVLGAGGGADDLADAVGFEAVDVASARSR
ncbi:MULTISPECIES: hypothetical protein [Streptomyces]|uniref:Uncharacterized protein n=2 Tax=Streptomyces TaxID=1883 RepID=A0ABU4JZN9_9ACTN|nr:hypothetical protein [Streptomyces roseolus]MDX2290952.1 hypothetical protein [Streptomyces roseolus]